MANLSSVIAIAVKLKATARLVDLITEDLDTLRNTPDALDKVKAALSTDPDLKPAKAILRNAEKLADELDSLNDLF